MKTYIVFHSEDKHFKLKMLVLGLIGIPSYCYSSITLTSLRNPRFYLSDSEILMFMLCLGCFGLACLLTFDLMRKLTLVDNSEDTELN
jgi:hypothetical protein